MKRNKRLTAKQTIIKKIQHLVWHDSTSMTHAIINGIMRQVNCEVHKIEKRRSDERKLIQFGKIRQSNYFYGYLNQMLADQPQKTFFSQDQQPSSIMIDNIAIAILQKTQNKSVRSVIFEQNKLTQSIVSQINTKKTKNNKPLSIQLPLQTIKQVKIITQMRQKKLNEQQRQKKQANISQQQIDLTLKRQNQLQKKAIFDYNGSILQRKEIEYGNLILKNLEQKLTKQKKIKTIEYNPIICQVQPNQKLKNRKKNRSKQIEDEYTLYFDSQSLADSIEINRGIRYSHNFLVFEQKKQTLSPGLLKSQLGNRKFSKEDFLTVKQFDQKVKSSRLRNKTQQFKASKFTHKRSLSEANFVSSRFPKRQTINVMNPKLRSSMLIRLSEYQPFLVIEKEIAQDPKLIYEHNGPLTITHTSQSQNNEIEQRSVVSGKSRMNPKLPPISRKISTTKTIEDQLIIGKLQKQLQNKLRI